MKNKLTDLNNHLFAQIERLSDEDLSDVNLEKEIKRADAVVKVADKIICSADTALRAAKIIAEYGGTVPAMPMLDMGSKE